MKGIVFTKPKFLKNLFRRNRPKFDIRKKCYVSVAVLIFACWSDFRRYLCKKWGQVTYRKA